MFLEQAIRTYVTTPVRCLDLCAAPGGKSTHLSSLLPDGSLLVSNEVIRNRSYILAENLAKWGSASTIVLNDDPAEIGEALPEQFDLIVTDVVYSPHETAMLKMARKAGCKTMNGQGMMLFQAIAAIELMLGQRVDSEYMKEKLGISYVYTDDDED